LGGQIQGSYVYSIQNTSILFSHSGFRTAFVDRLKNSLNIQSVDDISSHVNEQLKRRVKLCFDSSSRRKNCVFEEEVFQAGSDRGGRRMYLLHYQKNVLHDK
jgi:hypothetical protein